MSRMEEFACLYTLLQWGMSASSQQEVDGAVIVAAQESLPRMRKSVGQLNVKNLQLKEIWCKSTIKKRKSVESIFVPMQSGNEVR